MIKRWRKREEKTLGTECPKFKVKAKTVLLADMILCRPHTICWADSPPVAAGQWDPMLTRQEHWRRNKGEGWRRIAF